MARSEPEFPSIADDAQLREFAADIDSSGASFDTHEGIAGEGAVGLAHEEQKRQGG